MSDLTELRNQAQRGMDMLFPAGLLAWKEHEPETVWRISTVVVDEIVEGHLVLRLKLADTHYAMFTLHLIGFLAVKTDPPIARGVLTNGEAWILAQFPVRVN